MKVNLEVIFEDSDFPTKEQFKKIRVEIEKESNQYDNIETEFEARLLNEEFQEHFSEDSIKCIHGAIDFDKIMREKYNQDFYDWLVTKFSEEAVRRFKES